MKHCIRSIIWKFSDCPSTYPGLSDRKINIRSPADVYQHFGFLFKDQKRGSSVAETFALG